MLGPVSPSTSSKLGVGLGAPDSGGSSGIHLIDPDSLKCGESIVWGKEG